MSNDLCDDEKARINSLEEEIEGLREENRKLADMFCKKVDECAEFAVAFHRIKAVREMWVEKAEQAITRYEQDYAKLAERLPIVKMLRDRGIAYAQLPPHLQKDLDKQMKVVRWLSVPIFKGEETK